MKFKPGDWVIHELDIWQIEKVEDDRYDINDGTFSTYSRENDTFELTPHNKYLLEAASFKYQDICKLGEFVTVNWGDIRRNYIYHLNNLLSNPQNSDFFFKKLNEYHKDLCDKIVDLKYVTFHGIKLFYKGN